MKKLRAVILDKKCLLNLTYIPTKYYQNISKDLRVMDLALAAQLDARPTGDQQAAGSLHKYILKCRLLKILPRVQSSTERNTCLPFHL